MTRTWIRAVFFMMPLCFSLGIADDFSYDSVAKRFSETRLDAKSVQEARMQGECLVGLKELNFRKQDTFDPVAEWTSYRAFTLLEQFPPCTVLIIMEVARAELIDQKPES